MCEKYGHQRFFVEAVRVYGPHRQSRWNYRVRDKDQIVEGFGAKTVATSHEPDIADRIADTLNEQARDPSSKQQAEILRTLRAHKEAMEKQRDSARAERDAARIENKRLQSRPVWQEAGELREQNEKLLRERDQWCESYSELAGAMRGRTTGVPPVEWVQHLETLRERAIAETDPGMLCQLKLDNERLRTENTELSGRLDKLVGGGSPADRDVLLALARHINRSLGGGL